MANQVSPEDIDCIIDLIKQIAIALTKSDFLSKDEQILLERYQSCESIIVTTNEVRKVRYQTALSEDKRRQIEGEHNYDRNRALELKGKLSEAQREHIESINKLQEELGLYLAPRWPEILTLKTLAYPLQKEIEYFINADFGTVDKDAVNTTAKKVESELKRIKANLEYTQIQTPETKRQGSRPKKSIETNDETRTRKKQKLSKCHMRAWESYQWLQENRPDLIPKAEDNKNFTFDMYNCVMNESPMYHDDDGKPLKSVPGYEAWTRYIRFYVQRMSKGAS